MQLVGTGAFGDEEHGRTFILGSVRSGFVYVVVARMFARVQYAMCSTSASMWDWRKDVVGGSAT